VEVDIDGIGVNVLVGAPGAVNVSVAGVQGPKTLPSGLAGGGAAGSHEIVVTVLSSADATFVRVSTMVVGPVTLSVKVSPESRADAPLTRAKLLPDCSTHDRNESEVPATPDPVSADAGGDEQP
jgi:hypothetical protein